MPLISYSMVLLTGVCLYAFLHFLLHFIHSRRMGESNLLYLLFALMCLSVFGYMNSDLAAIHSGNAPAYVEIFRWRSFFGGLFLAILPWFVYRYTNCGSIVLVGGVSLYFSVFLLVNFVRPYGFYFDALPELTQMKFFWGEQITFFAHREMSLQHIMLWAGILILWAYTFVASYRQYQSGQHRTALWLGGSMLVFMLFIFENLLVVAGLIDFIYLAQYGFPVLIILMGMRLHAHHFAREERIQAFLNHVPAVVYMKDRKGRYLLINREFESNFQVDDTGVNGFADYALTDNTLADVFRDHDKDVLTRAKTIEFEEVARHPDGSLHTYYTIKFPLYQGSREPYAVCGISTDITTHKTLQTTYRSLFDLANDVLVLCDVDNGRILDINSAAGRLYGYSHDELLGMTFHDLNSNRTVQEVPGVMSRVRAQGSMVFEREHCTKDGRMIPVEVSSRYINLEDRPLLLSIVRDLTARKRTDEKLRLQAAALEVAANGIVIVGIDGTIQWVNQAFCDITGYDVEEVVGENFKLLNSGRHDSAFFKELWGTILDGRVWRGEIINRRKDGSFYTDEQTITPLVDEQGRVNRFIAIEQDITERKQAETRYRHLVEFAHAIPWELEIATWRFTYVGPQVEGVLGYPREHWYKEGFWTEHLHPDDRDWALRYCQAASAKGENHTFEYRMLAANGQIIWFYDDVTVVEGPEGPASLQGFLFDITDRKQAMIRVEQSELKFRTLFEAAGDAIFLMQEDRFVNCNTHTLEMFGCQSEEIVNHTPWDFSPATQYDGNDSKILGWKHIRTALEGNPQRFAWLHQQRDGTPFDAEVTLNRIELNDKPYLQAIVRDVTIRRRGYEALRHIAAGVSAKSSDVFFQQLVQQLCKLFDAKYAFIGLLDEKDPTLVNTLAMSMNGEFAKNISYHLEGTPCEKVMDQSTCAYPRGVQQVFPGDGLLQELKIEGFIGTPLFNSKQRPLGHIVVLDTKPLIRLEQVQPILEIFAARAAAEIERINAERQLARHRDQLEDAVAQRTKELRVANKELESFSYSVSHDLRSPLRSIDGFSQALIEDYQSVLDSKGKDFLKRIRSAAQQMDRIIDDMLMLSRVTRQEMSRKTVDLSALVNQSAQKYQGLDQTRKVQCDIAPGVMVNGDSGLLLIAIDNLMSNAWKYTSKTDQAKIEFNTKQESGITIYYIRDNGAGFDINHADKLFDAFQRLHRADEFEGTGIGLTTVARIIHRHGGEIWADAKPNHGATFYFTLDGSHEPADLKKTKE